MEQQDNTTQAGPTDSGYVTVDEAKYEDLESFLDKEKSASESEEGEQSQPAQPEEPSQEETQSEQQVAEEPSEEAPKQPVSREEFEKLERQMKGQELLIQRRTTQIAELSQQLKLVNEKLKAGLEEKYVEAPVAAMEDFSQIKENEKKIEELDAEKTRLVHEQQARQVVAHFIKPGEVSTDDIEATLLRHGVEKGYAKQFAANPISHAQPETVVFIAKLAKAEKMLAEIIPMTKKLYEEAKRRRGDPESVAQGVKRALSQTPTMTAASGGSTSRERTSEASVENMSYEELEGFLKSKR